MLGLNLPYLLCREGNDGKEMGRHLECDQNSELRTQKCSSFHPNVDWNGMLTQNSEVFDLFICLLFTILEWVSTFQCRNGTLHLVVNCNTWASHS